MWRKIYNASLLPAGTSIEEAGKRGVHAGYRLMAFNGDLYIIDSLLTPIQTRLTIEELKGFKNESNN